MSATDAPITERLPIKIILPKQGSEKKVLGGGSEVKPFRKVNSAYRSRLKREVTAIKEAVSPTLKGVDTAPIRVQLLTKAIAKSHRPEDLFSMKTCPIIGVGKLGEIYIKASRNGLEQLSTMIESGGSKQIVKQLSEVDAIEIVTPLHRRRGLDSQDILRRSPKGKSGFITKVRLFDFGDPDEQAKHVALFEAVCHGLDAGVDSNGYSESSLTYGVECHTVDDIEQISKIIGVRSVTSMPLIRTIKLNALNPKPLPKLLPVNNGKAADTPVVVVVDSGVSDKMPELNSWVIGRDTQVAPPYRNNAHGTFVAGLICWGSQLNPTIRGIDSNPCAIFDLQLLPNTDPAKGQVESLHEQEFLNALNTALKQYADKFKVWNLSLGTDYPCSLDDFSTFAEELDNLQEKYHVSFVISAGNFNSPPLMRYPRTEAELEKGRITVPADSVLAITVGSVSHVDYLLIGPGEHEPSAFSRNGAGPNYIIKPDLVHYGGACSCDFSHASGIRSITELGSAENLGTSFSAPLVSRILAQIYHNVSPTPTPTLARALITHHARDPRTGGRVPDGEEQCFGFGLPASVPYCLECTPHSSTFIFDDELKPGFYLEWDDFPYPNSLTRDGRYYGEIWMTVAFSPERGGRWGSEYCETHIEAKFGVYEDTNEIDKKTGEIKQEFRSLVPPEHNETGLLYESYQVAKLRKWAPVRTYHGDLGDKGESGSRWRLKVQLLTRHGIDQYLQSKPQPFSLVVTIADPKNQAPIYDEMARVMRTRFKTQNLVIRPVTRIRGTS